MRGVLCHGQWLCPDHKYHETSKSQMEPLRSKAELADLQQVFFRDIRWGGAPGYPGSSDRAPEPKHVEPGMKAGGSFL